MTPKTKEQVEAINRIVSQLTENSDYSLTEPLEREKVADILHQWVKLQQGRSKGGAKGTPSKFKKYDSNPERQKAYRLRKKEKKIEKQQAAGKIKRAA